MSDFDRKYLCPRLIDYVAIIGRNSYRNKPNIKFQKPQLLRRYPSENHKDFPFPLDMVYFCQPEGCIFLQDGRKAQQIDPFSFIFSLTDKDSSRTRFGVCLNFYRPLERIRSKRKKTEKSDKAHKNIDLSSESDFKIEDIPKYSSRTYALTSLCIISHYAFFTGFRECLSCLKKIIDACRDSTNFSRSTRSRLKNKENVWSVLTGQVTDITSSIVMHDISEIEKWISRLISAPVPIPGKTKIKLTIFTENQEPLLLALPDHKRFSFVDYPLYLPIELLGVENFIKVLTLILMENKIIFQSRNYNVLSMSIMAFVTMIYPLEYMFPIIPLLPTCMSDTEQLLFSPTPYIIGIPASFSDEKYDFRYPDDIWLIDLDANNIRTKNPSEIPQMPEMEVTVLKNNLRKAMKLMEQFGSEKMSNNLLTSRSNSIVASKRKSIQEDKIFLHATDSNSIDVAIRVSLVEFFNSPNLLANFSEHTRTLRLYPRPVVAFQINSFLRSRNYNSTFLYQFAKTQAVEFFAEWSLTPDNVSYLRVHTGIVDPLQIGDKPKWFEQNLELIEFQLWDSSSSLNGAIKLLKSEHYKVTVDSSISDSYEGISSESSMENYFHEEEISSDIESDIDSLETNPISPFIYRPPSPFEISVSAEKNDILESSDLSSSDTTNSSEKVSDQDEEVSLHDNIETNKHESQFDTKIVEKALSLNDFRNEKSPILNRSMSVRSRPSPPINPSSGFLRQPSIGNVFPKKTVTDQSDGQISKRILKQISSQAKELIKQKITQENNNTLITNTRHNMDHELPMSPFEHLTMQAKKAAEIASESVHDVSKTALEVSKNAADASKNTFEDLSFLSKSKMEDFTQSAKIAVIKKRLSQDEKTSDKSFKESPKMRFTNFGSDFQVLASSTSTMFSDFFKGNKDKTINNNNNQIKNNQISITNKNIFGPFSEGTKGVIRHSVNQEDQFSDKVFSNEDNQEFAKECVTKVLNGEGINWLKLSRLRKLLEDESIRNLLLNKMNLTLSQKISPNDQIDDICISKPVWKGMLKILLSVAHGLDVSNKKLGCGGLASTFQLHEIGHTHYWSKYDSFKTSPLSSNEYLENSSRDERKISEIDFHETSNSSADTLKNLLNQKRKHLNKQISSIDSDSDSLQNETGDTLSSSRGSITSGPVFVLSKLGIQSPYRLTASDTDIETSRILRQTKRNIDSISNKTSYSNEIMRNFRTLYSEEGTGLETDRFYLYEGLLGKNRIPLWDQMQFWEDVFFDVVSYERDIIGLDHGPREMIEKYRKFNNVEKKRLEHEEDRLLSTILYNLVAIMVMLEVNKNQIKTKVRRLLGKCHISIIYSKEVNSLLDNINKYNGNDIDLKPMISRLINRHIFTVHLGSNAEGDLRFMEIRDDGLIIRSDHGIIVERWWFERLVNMTYSPKTKVLCLWKRNEQQTTLQKFYSKKCRNLYYAIKQAIEKNGKINAAPELGGEFPVQDLKTGEGGILQICIEGVGLLLMNSKADKICYAVLCVFSYVAAGDNKLAHLNASSENNQKKLQFNSFYQSNKSNDNSDKYISDSQPPKHPAPILSIDELTPPPIPPRLPLRTNMSLPDN